MHEQQDDNFDSLLSEHLSRELDSQLGRATVKLARLRPNPWRLIALSTLATAAAIGAFLIRPRQPDLTPAPAPAQTVAIDYQLDWQTIDLGTVLLEDQTPVRRYVRREIETARWIDPSTKAQLEMVVPNDQIMLIGLNTY
jgi:hypothetical protein